MKLRESTRARKCTKSAIKSIIKLSLINILNIYFDHEIDPFFHGILCNLSQISNKLHPILNPEKGYVIFVVSSVSWNANINVANKMQNELFIKFAIRYARWSFLLVSKPFAFSSFYYYFWLKGSYEVGVRYVAFLLNLLINCWVKLTTL